MKNRNIRRLLGLSILLGSFVATPSVFGAPTNINLDNQSLDQDVYSGTLGEHSTINLENSSSWLGAFEVGNGATGEITLNDSVWTFRNFNFVGNDSELTINVNNGSTLKSDGSPSTDFIVEGVATFNIDNSSLQTKINSNYEGNTTVNLANNSTWEGNLSGYKGVSTVKLNDSSWIGELMSNFNQTEIELKNSAHWEGSATALGKTLDITLENSSWTGDLHLTSYLPSRMAPAPRVFGSPSTGTIDFNHSIWTGNLFVEFGSEGYISLENASLWTGNSVMDEGEDSVINLSLAGNSNWEMTDTSMVTDLSIDNSTITFLPQTTPGQFSVLTVFGSYTNTSTNSLISMNTDIGGLQGDLLDIQGSSSGSVETQIQVTNNGASSTDGTELLTIVATDDGVATFKLTNLVEAGGYTYDLRRSLLDNTDWELYRRDESSSTADAGVNLFSGAYLLNYAETQTLLKRLGDLRSNPTDNGIWARVYGGKFSSSSDGFLHGFDMNYWGTQVGYDKKIEREDKKGTVYVGGFFGYSKGNLDYLENGSGSIDSKSLGAYWTHIHHNGFYADAVFKYNWMKNDFKHLDSAGKSVHGDDINTRGFTGSFEVGRRYFFDKTDTNGEKLKNQDRQGWYVEPQFQLSVGQQSGGHFTASNGLRIKADSFRSVMARTELHLGYEVKEGKNPINVYGKLGVVKEFDGDVDYYLNGSHEQTSYGDTWKLWGAGITAQFSQKHNLYLEVERATGGKFTQNWGVNGGYRYSW